MAVTLMTVSEYARHRGCDEKAVRKAVAEGRISAMERDGKKAIDPEVADIQWARNTRARVRREPVDAARPAGQVAQAAQALPAAVSGTGGPAGMDNLSYSEAARLLKIEEARLKRLEREEQERKLTDAADAGRAVWTAFRTLRDTVMPTGRRVAAKVASMTDAREIQLLIDEALREALRTFAERTLQAVSDQVAGSAASIPADVATDTGLDPEKDAR